MKTSLPRHWRILLAAAWLCSPLAIRAADTPASIIPPAAGQATVVWISMDGMRNDYLDRAPLPFFHRLMKEGAYSRRFRPAFPPITFPSHCAEATGVAVAQHGITGNSFYDSATRETYNYPHEARLLQAEPIWLTAARQGIRALVFDWPVSQMQTGPVKAAYSLDAFVNGPTDAERLNHLLDVWQADRASGQAQPDAHHAPLRLLMGYVEGADPTGHKYGPDAPQIAEELTRLDGELNDFAARALAQWKTQANPVTDRFYLLLTTDHGMSKVDKLVNLEKLLGLPHGQSEITLSTVGNMGNVFLDQVPAGAAREARLAALLEKLRESPFARVYKREELPADWHYGHPTRTGDLVVVLPKGYTFSKAAPRAVVDMTEADSPKGMHGYPLEDDPEMYGVTLVWRYPNLIGGQDLGEVNWDQYEPTAAKWLNIQSAPGAKGKPPALSGE